MSLYDQGRAAAQTHIDAAGPLHDAKWAESYAEAVETQSHQDDHARGFAARLREHAAERRKAGR